MNRQREGERERRDTASTMPLCRHWRPTATLVRVMHVEQVKQKRWGVEGERKSKKRLVENDEQKRMDWK